MRVVTVCGTRPELIKLAPLVPELASRFEHTYLFTGQHYSPSMVQVFVDELDAPAPDLFLNVGSSDLDALRLATEAALRELRPEVVLVYGDTNSTLAAAEATSRVGATLVHIEAGIRSFDRTMPEENNRIVVDTLAQLRLAPTGLATWFLEVMEGRSRVTSPAVGNLAVDAWRRHEAAVRARPLPSILRGIDDFAVMTLHRQATVDDPEVFARALGELSAVELPIFFPVHPRTAARVEEFGLRWPDNMLVVEPLGYLDFMRAAIPAGVLLTDSGGVQEEAISIDVPCVTLRPNTERLETVFAGANRLFDLERDRGLAGVVRDAIDQHDRRPCKINPFGGGHTWTRCVTLLELMAGREPSVAIPHEHGLADRPELQAAVAAIERAMG